MQPEDKFIEYIDALVTCELAMMMAIRYKEEPDSPVRSCAKRMTLKCLYLTNKQLFLGVSKSELPSAMIYYYRTMLDEAISK